MGEKRVWISIRKDEFPPVWFLTGTSQGTYLSKYVFNAELGKVEKLYLSYVAAMTNFSKKTPCFASRDEMMNAMSMSQDTLYRVKRRLIELDWIVCYERAGTSDLQFPAVGSGQPGFTWKVPEKRRRKGSKIDQGVSGIPIRGV